MSKKYELIQSDCRILFGVKLFRIQALIDIPDAGVSAGDRGGYIEKEENLSCEGSAWVSGNAKVSGNARVYGKVSK